MELTRLIKIAKSWPESLYGNKSNFLPEAMDEYESRLVRLLLIVNERGIVPFFLQDEEMGGKIVNDRATEKNSSVNFRIQISKNSTLPYLYTDGR